MQKKGHTKTESFKVIASNIFWGKLKLKLARVTMKIQIPENTYRGHFHDEEKFGMNSLCNVSTNQFPWNNDKMIGFCPELPMQTEMLDNTKQTTSCYFIMIFSLMVIKFSCLDTVFLLLYPHLTYFKGPLSLSLFWGHGDITHSALLFQDCTSCCLCVRILSQ